jgi:O-antigen/teichoic acid export membrane protein
MKHLKTRGRAPSSNAAWNTARALVSSGLGFLTTPILIGRLSSGDYSAWVLISTITSYLSILDVGLAAENARVAAVGRQSNDPTLSHDTTKALLVIYSLICLLMLGALAALVVAFPTLFSEVPRSSIPQARLALIATGVSTLTSMLVTPIAGLTIGVGRADIPAKAAIVSRIAVFVWLVLASGKSLSVFSLGVGAFYTAAALFVAFSLYRVEPKFRLRTPFRTHRPYRRLAEVGRQRAVWSVGLLVVTTCDVLIVGEWDYQNLVPFSLAATLTLIAYTVLDAAAGSLVPQMSVLHLKSKGDQRAWLKAYQRFVITVAAIETFGLLLTLDVLVPAWVGANRAEAVGRFLIPLAAVTYMRLINEGLLVLNVCSGEQRLCAWNPVWEAVVKLIGGIVLVQSYGAIGVVIAAGAAAAVSLSLTLWRSLRRSRLAPSLGALPELVVPVCMIVGGATFSAGWLDHVVRFVALVGILLGLVAYVWRSELLKTLGLLHRTHTYDAKAGA